MARPVTLFTGQWADLPLETLAAKAKSWGYDGLELASWGDHLDVFRAADDASYARGRLDLLAKHGLSLHAFSVHLAGQLICDEPLDARHAGFVPPDDGAVVGALEVAGFVPPDDGAVVGVLVLAGFAPLEDGAVLVVAGFAPLEDGVPPDVDMPDGVPPDVAPIGMLLLFELPVVFMLLESAVVVPGSVLGTIICGVFVPGAARTGIT